MMDIQPIAATAIALLSPYIAKGTEEFAKSAGKAAAEKVGALYQAIKKRLRGDAYAEQTLTRAEEKPESEGRQAALKEVLAEKMEENTDFAETVRRLVEESKQLGGGDIINQQIKISGRAQVGDVFQVGTLEGGISKKESDHPYP